MKNWIASSLMLLAMTGAVASFFLITACSSSDDADKKKTKKAEIHYIIYSPNAEPLNGGVLGYPTCEAAFTKWFERTDTNHDGVIDKNEYLADAKVQFNRMDIDHNGYLVSEELDRYRAPFRPADIFGKDSASDDDQSEEEKQKHEKRGAKGPKKGTNDALNPANLIDPVMSADTNLDFKVTPDEFMKQAKNHFGELDADHNGTLTRDEVLKLCAKSTK